MGLATPEWCPFSGPQYAQEQSEDDARSLLFDTAPLDAPLDILGTPLVHLRVASDRPVAKLAARLCEIDADRRSWLVSYGVMNLTHRESHAEPSPLAPGVFYDISLPLYLTGRRLAAGSRLRLALSQALWPLIWPAPEPVRLSVDLAGSSLALPVRPPDRAAPAFPIPLAEARASGGGPRIERVQQAGRGYFSEVSPPSAGVVAEVGTTVERFGPDVAAEVRAGDPAGCRWRASQGVRYARDGWDCGVEAEVEITATASKFQVRERLVARKAGAEVFSREHDSAIPRDLM